MTVRILTILGLAAMAGCRATPSITLEATQTLTAEHGADPTVAIDGRTGTTYLAWATMAPDSTWNVVVAARTGNGPFSAPVRANRIPGEVVSSNQFPPQIQVGDDGAVHLAWLAIDKPAQVVVIRVVRSGDGGTTFDSAATLGIGDRGPFPSLYYDMATGPNRAVYVSWLDLGRFAAQEAEQAKHKADSTPAPAPAPVNADLRFARSTDDGRTFSMMPVIDSSSCICCRASVAGGEDGKAYLMWRHVFPGDVRDVVVAVAPATGPVGPTVRVHEDHWEIHGCPELGPDLGVGTDGGVHVAWYTGAPGRQGLYYARSTDGGRTFSQPYSILAGPAISSALVKLAVADTTPWLAWEEPRPTETRLRLGHATPNSVVSVEEPIGVGKSPAIAAGHGRVAVAWADHGKVQVRFGALAPAKH